MPVETSAPWADRLARLRAELERARMDALIVSHPPNLRYLTSFHGSAGALLLLPARTLLVVDFRYGVVARAAGRISGCETVIAPVSLDETIVAALQTSGAKRIGVARGNGCRWPGSIACRSSSRPPARWTWTAGRCARCWSAPNG